MKINKKAFTLVELIVVVTILSLLSAIGFVSYVTYLVGVRDTNRVVQLTSINDGFKKHGIQKQLPLPNDSIEIKANGVSIGFQGYAGESVLETIEFTQNGKDPKERVYFNYYLTSDRKHFQIMAYLEDQDNLQVSDFNIPFFGKKANASIDYTTRYPTVLGDKLGILTQKDTNVPLQDLDTVTNELGGVLDIATTQFEFNSYFSDDDYITGTGATLIRILPNGSCKRVKQLGRANGSGIYKLSIDGLTDIRAYCDMETDGGGWTLVLKANGNNTTFGYDSPYWTDSTGYNTGSYRYDDTEFKSQLFSTLYFDDINIQLSTGGYINTLTLPVSANSLRELFNGGFTQTNLGRDLWKGLIADSSLQDNCNQEGINNDGGGATKVRIGILGNNENDCNSVDSRLGIGGIGNDCGQYSDNSVGNEARCSSDNGNQTWRSMGYIFIK